MNVGLECQRATEGALAGKVAAAKALIGYR